MKDVKWNSLTCREHGINWDILLSGSLKMIEDILNPNGGTGGGRGGRIAWSAPLGNLSIHGGLGKRTEESSYRNTLIIRTHFASTIWARENPIDSVVKVGSQGFESGIVAECMTGRAGFDDEGIDPDLNLIII